MACDEDRLTGPELPRDFAEVIGLDALLQNKRATGRAKDAVDADELESLRRGA